MRRGLIAVLAVALPMQAAVVGMNTPVRPLTVERVRAEVPKAEQGAWVAYLRASAEQMAADKAALAKERAGMAEVPGLPKQGYSGRAMRLDAGDAFYKSEAARRTGDAILSFQTPAGGWSKNLAMDEVRKKGQSYATANLAPVTTTTAKSEAEDFDAPKDPKWHYVGTLDNDATNTELRFLAELAAAWPGHEGDAYRASFLRGVEYLLRAQYPNGGWPQVWPLEGGYHDAVTFNDDAVVESAETLGKVAAGVKVVTTPSAEEIQFARLRTYPGGQTIDLPEASTEDYSFVPAAVRVRARAAVARAVELVLRAQVRVGGVLTVWAQQYDPLTLEPVSARNYEMPALSSGESASAMRYLMSLPKPSPEVVASVEAAAAWFEAKKIVGYTWSGGRGTPGGRKLTAVAGAGPLWARYYSLGLPQNGGGKPIFGDRDKTIHDDVMEISDERRNGYAWYSGGEEAVLVEYAAWRKGRE